MKVEINKGFDVSPINIAGFIYAFLRFLFFHTQKKIELPKFDFKPMYFIYEKSNYLFKPQYIFIFLH